MDKKLKDFIDDVSSKFKGKIKDDDSKDFGCEGDVKADYNFDYDDDVFPAGFFLPADDKHDINKTPKTEEDEQS